MRLKITPAIRNEWITTKGPTMTTAREAFEAIYGQPTKWSIHGGDCEYAAFEAGYNAAIAEAVKLCRENDTMLSGALVPMTEEEGNCAGVCYAKAIEKLKSGEGA